MSFILEALRRADRERKTGANPDLQRVVEMPLAAPARRRRPRRLILAAAAVLGAAAATALLWPQTRPAGPTNSESPLPPVAVAAPTIGRRTTPGRPPSPTAEQTAPTPPAAQRPVAEPPLARPAKASRPAPRPAPRRSTVQGLQAPEGRQPSALTSAPPRARAPVPAPAPELPPPKEPAAPATKPVTAAKPQPVRARPQAVVQAPAAEVAPASEPAPSLPSQTTEPVEPAEPAHPAKASAPPVEVPPAPSTNAPLLNELSPSQRELFADVRLDAHVYGTDPTARFVLIGMRSYRVGDSVGAGELVVEAITADGAILRSGAVRALLPHP